jgi:hypothetical protein
MSFKHFAKATLGQGAQIQLKIFSYPLTVSAMRLERRLGYETEGRCLHTHMCRLRPQRTSLVWSSLVWSEGPPEDTEKQLRTIDD